MGIKELTTLRGIATGIISGALLAYFPRLRHLLYLPMAGGVYQLFRGFLRTFDEKLDIASRQEAGRQVGKGLFYSLPLLAWARHFLTIKQATALKYLLVQQAEARGGRVVTNQSELQSFSHAFRQELNTHLRERVPQHAERILHAYDHPETKGLEAVSGVVSLAHVIGILKMYVLRPFLTLRDPELKALSGVAVAAVKFHEAIHLAQKAKRFPRLATYCHRHGIDRPQLRALLRPPPDAGRPPIWETVSYYLIRFPRRLESEAYALEHQAIHKILRGVNWSRTCGAVAERAARRNPHVEPEIELVIEYGSAIEGLIHMALGSETRPFVWSILAPESLPRLSIAGRDPFQFILSNAYIYCSARWARESVSDLLAIRNPRSWGLDE